MISDHSTIKPCEVSIVLPVYNESLILEKNVAQVDQAVRAVTNSYEIVVVEDGSTDGSDMIAGSLSQKNSRITHLHSDTRLGKGRALKNAFKKCRGEIVLFMDIDLATNLRHIEEFIRLIGEGNDVIVGSRARRGAKVHRPLVRKIASHGYNLLVNILFYDKVYDHQCGFKAFRRTVLASVIDEVDDNGFFFDTELMVRIQRKDYRIVECPIEWTEPRVSYVHEDPVTLFFKLIGLRFRLL